MSPESQRSDLPAEFDKLGLRPEPEFEEETDNYRIAGHTSADRMKGFLLLEKKQAELALTYEHLLERIRAGGITFGLDDNSIRRCLARAEGRDKVQIMEIARGREAENGQDGKLEFYVQPSSEEARYTKDASGRVNYHELNLIENVSAEQEVARLLPPQPGVAGSNVMGEVLPSRGGEPARIRPGHGLRVGGNGDVFIAEIAGRMVNNGDTLEISQQFEVRGNVDFSVGNIDFVGKVVVTGEVLDDFSVRAAMGLEVHGPVGNCKLESGGDVMLGGGMAGKTKGSIKAGGKVHAKYLNEVHVEAGGSVTVDREAFNSSIRTTGAFYATGGKILGGEVIALKGIEAGTAGSELGVPTKLVTGVDFRSGERARAVAEEMAKLDKEIERVSSAIGPLLADPKKVQHLPPEKKQAVLGLVSHLKTMKTRRDELSSAHGAQAHHDGGSGVRQINIKEKVFAGVTAEIAGCRLLLKKEATGPLTMVEDVGSGSIRLMGYQELGHESGEQPPPNAAPPRPDAPGAPRGG
jgi:hypothetical protein